MSAKCRRTAAVMSISRKVTPICSQSFSALERVRFVVPKQGMDTATMSFRLRPRRSIVRAATSSARQLSSPPETPTTTAFARVCSTRFFRP